MSARVLHLGQVVIDLTMRVPHLPARGGDVFATESAITAGGGYNVLHASRQMGARTVYCGAIGSGPMADIARASLQRIGVEVEGATIHDLDTGYSVAATEPDGERSFLSTRGAETRVPEDSYAGIPLEADDVIYLTGYSLCHRANRKALLRFAEAHRDESRHIVFDVSPMIDSIDTEALTAIGRLRPLWSLNQRETALLCSRLGVAEDIAEDADTPSGRCALLADRLGSPVLSRAGSDGAWIAGHGLGTAPTHIPTPRVEPVDTNGAGDAHSGVLCAALAEGMGLEDSLLLANCAGALSAEQFGPATCPTRAEVEEAAANLR